MIFAVFDLSVIDICDPSHEVLATLVLRLHCARSVDAEVANRTTFEQLVEESVLRLPILQGKALTIENTTKRLYGSQLLHLRHIDIGFEADLALVVFEGGDIATLVDRGNKHYQIFCILDTSCMYRYNR